ncbi:hypothetical protein TIFTF001_030465 [Ficus carica]|uniref:Uncharacterized protein n=1 Tax=Ficus carica TaxID=3494 RepID=A0AA88DU85_FICCA|nr:hypothetical protein TIFTF001_030465 [Ficus carica]
MDTKKPKSSHGQAMASSGHGQGPAYGHPPQPRAGQRPLDGHSHALAGHSQAAPAAALAAS